jgi:hypothetical protein
MEFLKKLFAESSEVSCMRFMSVLSLIFGFFVSGIGIFQGKDLSQLAVLSGVFVGAAFGGKVAQKFGEKSASQSSSSGAN